MPGTTSRDHERATVSVRGTVQTFDRFQGVDDLSWTDRLPHVVAVIKFEEAPEMISKVMGDGVLAVTFDDAVEVVDERKSAKAASVQFKLMERS